MGAFTSSLGMYMIAKPWPGEKVPGTRFGSAPAASHWCWRLFAAPLASWWARTLVHQSW